MKPVLVTDFGVMDLPENLPQHRTRKDGQPDMRFKMGRTIQRYVNDMNKAAEAVYVTGRDMTIAVPFSDWARNI
jgi:hypothetical protein